MEILSNFFRRIEDNEKRKHLIGLFDRTFQFKLSDGDPFVMKMENGSITFEKTEISKPDLLKEVTLIETDTQTISDLVDGKLGPSDALDDGRLWMSSLMAAKPQNFHLLRLLRTGQELR